MHTCKKWQLHYITHTRLTALFPGLPRWAGTRKVKPIWILLKQETVSGSGISWDICKSAPHSRQTTTPAPHCSVFYRPDALPAAQPTASKHFRDIHHKLVNSQSNTLIRKRLVCWFCYYKKFVTRRLISSRVINLAGYLQTAALEFRCGLEVQQTSVQKQTHLLCPFSFQFSLETI